MVEKQRSFGEICKNLRAERGLYLADQAEALKVSVSLVSAIELGNRSIPDGYPERVAAWFHLDSTGREELISSAIIVSNVIEFKPKNPATAKFAFEVSRRLNSLSPNEVDRIREILDRGEKVYE
ncbi:MAG: helix-turn-helix transcriptional regulator [Aestuariivirga sp.]